MDRYEALGIKCPDPDHICKGHCEGVGFYPTQDKSEWPPDAVPDEIGYVFVKCKPCNGTGLRYGPVLGDKNGK